MDLQNEPVENKENGRQVGFYQGIYLLGGILNIYRQAILKAKISRHKVYANVNKAADKRRQLWKLKSSQAGRRVLKSAGPQASRPVSGQV